MTEQKFSYIKPIKALEVTNFEDAYGIKFPPAFVNFILMKNGARASKSCFKVGTVERVMKRFLSFNKNGKETAWRLNDVKKSSFIAFAIDEFGNRIGFKDGEIYFYNHERDKYEWVASNFEEFLGILY